MNLGRADQFAQLQQCRSERVAGGATTAKLVPLHRAATIDLGRLRRRRQCHAAELCRHTGLLAIVLAAARAPARTRRRRSRTPRGVRK
jgi:hypothetical protein